MKQRENKVAPVAPHVRLYLFDGESADHGHGHEGIGHEHRGGVKTTDVWENKNGVLLEGVEDCATYVFVLVRGVRGVVLRSFENVSSREMVCDENGVFQTNREYVPERKSVEANPTQDRLDERKNR